MKWKRKMRKDGKFEKKQIKIKRKKEQEDGVERIGEE
jgi:hypothetical protein